MFFLFLLTIYTNFNGQRLHQSVPIRWPKSKHSTQSSDESKWYFIKLQKNRNLSLNNKEEYSRRSSKMNQRLLFEDFSHIFVPTNYVDCNLFKAYLSPSELSSLHSYSSYGNSSFGLEIYEITDEIKSNNLNNINLKEIESIEDDSFYVQATNEFPATFSRYGQISKIFNDNYYFRLNTSSANATPATSKRSFRQRYEEIVNEFLKSNIIYSFMKAPKMEQLNRYSVGFIQTGVYLIGEYYGNKQIYSENPLFKHGYTGANEVITVSDSGLSDRSIYFRNSNGVSSDYPYDTTDLNHRKVVRYTTRQMNSSSDKSDFSGHGTHVAATACGQSYDPDSIYSLYNGAAPSAKIFVVDLEDSKGNLAIDVNLELTLKNMSALQSYINTNSWGSGSESSGATKGESIYNDAAVQRPDILFLFSAGNNGRFQSIDSPGSGKNVLTVGALETLETTAKLNVSSSNDIKLVDDFEYDVYSDGGVFLGPRLVDLDVRYKMLIREMSLNMVSVNIHELKFEKYDDSILDFSEEIVHVVSCAEANRAASRKAKAIYVQEDKSTFFAASLEQCNNYNTIAFREFSSNISVSTMYGKYLTILPQLPENKRSKIPDVAAFSSRGPSNYGAIKPEVVAPGSNISSGSTFSNNMIRVASGTSMATPLVAGTIAVIRNYLKIKYSSFFGWFSANFIQSHLLKAIVVASADKPDNSVPDFKYGFGMVNLKNVIPELVGGSIPSSINYFQFFTDIKLFANNHYYYKFNITKNIQMTEFNNGLRVCFSYLDQTASSNSVVNIKANINLVHIESNTVWYPLGDKNEDYFSTVERIFVPNEEVLEGEYIIVISTSSTLFSNYQNYYKMINGSIVVSGYCGISNINGKVYLTSIESDKAELTNLWSNILCHPTNTISSAVDNSELEYGGCQCDKTKSTGLHCQFNVNQYSFNSESVMTVLKSFETAYFVSTVTSSSVNSLNFSWEQKPISSSNGSTNYLMLRMDINKSNQRVSHYYYFYASNLTTVVISGPTDSYGQPLSYTKGTNIFYAFTNFGEKPINLKTAVNASFIKRANSSSSRKSSLASIIFPTFITIIIIIFIVILANYCRKKMKKGINNRVEGQPSSSSSSNGRRRFQNYPPGNQPPPNAVYCQAGGAAVIITTGDPHMHHKKRHHSSSSSSSSSVQNIGNYNYYYDQNNNNNSNNAAYYYAPGQYPNYSAEPGSPAYFGAPPAAYIPTNPQQPMPPAYMVPPQTHPQQMHMQMQQQQHMMNGCYTNQEPTIVSGAPNSAQNPYAQQNNGSQPNPYDIP